MITTLMFIQLLVILLILNVEIVWDNKYKSLIVYWVYANQKKYWVIKHGNNINPF